MIQETIEENGHVTEGQLVALENMENGVRNCIR
jgi:hypothetical protein